MTFSDKTKHSRTVVLASYACLLLTLLFNHWLLALPLALFSWSLWNGHWRSHIWLCFVLLFYFLLNINQLAQQSSASSSLAVCGLWFENISEVVLFTSAMLWCRWSKRSDTTANNNH